MHRIKIMKGYKTHSIDINYLKVLIGSNIESKYDLYYQLKSYFSKVGDSDFSIKNHYKQMVTFDETSINLKEWLFFDVHPFFDIETDLKMGTKSLITKYLTCFNESIERNEILNTILILMNSLNDDFFKNESDLTFGDKTLQLRLGEISRHTIFKEISPTLVNDNFECNTGDLNYEDVLLLQLSLINQIALKNRDYKILIFCTIPKLTKRIKEILYNFKYANTYILLNTNDLFESDYTDFYILSEKHCLDLGNEEMIIDILMDLPFYITKEEFIGKMKNRISSEKVSQKDPLNIEFFSYKM